MAPVAPSPVHKSSPERSARRSQSSDCQGEPRDIGQGTIPPSTNSLPGSTHSASVAAEAFMSPLPLPFPQPIIPTNGSWPGGVDVSDEAYVLVPPDPSEPLYPGRQPIDPMASAGRLSYLPDETLDDDGGFQGFGAPDATLFSSPLSYSDYASDDTIASVVVHTNNHQPTQVSFLGEASYPIGPPFRHATYPTPAIHAAASGRLQSNTRSATFPLPSYPTYFNYTPHDEWPQRPPLDTYPSQDGIDGIPLATFPTSTSMISQGVRFPIRNTMPLSPAAFSGPSGHAPVYGPSISAPAVSNYPQTRTLSTSYKTVSRVRKPRPIAQSQGVGPKKARARAELKKGSVISFGDGCRLDKVSALPADYDTVAFDGQIFTQKTSFRLEVSGYELFNHQFNVLLHNGEKQPTKRRLAEVAVVAVKFFTHKCVASGRPCKYQLEHFVLRGIKVHSRSSLQLEFDFRIPASAT